MTNEVLSLDMAGLHEFESTETDGHARGARVSAYIIVKLFDSFFAILGEALR